MVPSRSSTHRETARKKGEGKARRAAMADTLGISGRPRSAGFAGLRQSAEELLPLIEAEADGAESQSHQSDRVVAALRQSGIYAMLLPRALGGGELPFVEAMEIIARLSWADASAGWCSMVAGVMSASLGAFVPEQGARAVYGNGPDVTVAGNGVPRGYARRVPGGYMIRGHWAYGSGIHHAEWVHSGCFVMDGDKPALNAEGAPEIVLTHHPKASIALKGNWDVLGLRATGSFDYTLKEPELFVPEHMTYSFDGAKVQRGGAQYQVGLVGLTSWGHTSWALGVGRRALDELARIAHERADVFGKLTESPAFKKSFADAEAKFRAASALVYQSWGDLSGTIAQGGAPSVEQIALIRLAMRHLHDALSEVTTFAHRTARGISLRAGKLQRCYRDAHAGTQHLLLADEIMMECGRVLMGATGPGAYWTMFGVKG
jgi:alkylation response protein AidB-like acyl-CoA dehydrogenase